MGFLNETFRIAAGETLVAKMIFVTFLGLVGTYDSAVLRQLGSPAAAPNQNSAMAISIQIFLRYA